VLIIEPMSRKARRLTQRSNTPAPGRTPGRRRLRP
jgi:hypothetical protein